ncbi:MAG: glycosyltransferase [bacterium]|nr:glycosyltransferase [bacterium]
MRVIWVNSGTTRTLSNTRLYGIPPIFNRWGDRTWVLIGGPKNQAMPDYFLTLPVPFGRLGIYRLLVTLLLPVICLVYRPDVLITDWTSATLTRFVVSLKRLGISKIRLVHDVRTVPVKEDGGRGRHVYEVALNFAKKYFDGITTITVPLRSELCKEFGFSENQIAVWTSGVDENHFHPQDSGNLRDQLGLVNNFIVFYHGSVNVNRGVLELAMATDYLKDIPELRLLIVGAGNQWDRLMQVVNDQRLDQVILKPSVPYNEIPRWIALADLCAVPLPDHPWWRVSSPLKLIEYLSMAKPVLLTDMVAHRAILPDDDQAFYVSSIQPDVLAEGIRRAYQQRQRFAELGVQGQKIALSSLTWQAQAEILKDYLQRVLAGDINLRDSN